MQGEIQKLSPFRGGSTDEWDSALSWLSPNLRSRKLKGRTTTVAGRKKASASGLEFAHGLANRARAEVDSRLFNAETRHFDTVEIGGADSGGFGEL